MPTMSSLATGTPTTRRLTDQLGSIQRIGRRGRRAIGGIALELKEKFLDLGFERDDPSEGRVKFTTQPQATRTFRAFGRSL
jgi:hypothetical protein